PHPSPGRPRTAGAGRSPEGRPADRPDLLVYLLPTLRKYETACIAGLRLAHERAAQPGCSSRALRRSRPARGGRRPPADAGAGRGEVRVRVLASSVQYTDVLIRRHLYPQTAARLPPFVLGYDVVGEIDQLGDGVRGFQVGDRVADLTVVGSNTAYRTLRADR